MVSSHVSTSLNVYGLWMVTSGSISSDRIISPLGMSLVSARWTAAS